MYLNIHNKYKCIASLMHNLDLKLYSSILLSAAFNLLFDFDLHYDIVFMYVCIWF